MSHILYSFIQEGQTSFLLQCCLKENVEEKIPNIPKKHTVE